MTSMPTTVQEELLKSERPVEAFPAGMRIEWCGRNNSCSD